MAGIAAVYSDADTFTVATDMTLAFVVGRRVKCDCGVDGYKYGTVESSSYAALKTTVNLASTNDDITSNLVGVWFGIVSPGTTGSVPVHDHDDDEGDGGNVDDRYYTETETDTIINATRAYSYFADYSETDQGVAGSGNTINALVDAISTDNATICLRHNSGSATTTYTLTTSETIPANITLEIENGAIIDGAGTLTLDRPEQIIGKRNQQIFGSSITISFTNTGTICPEWWGVDGTDDQVQINSAVSSLTSGGVISLAGKTYNIELASGSEGITMGSNIWLHGIRGVTTLKIPDSGDGCNPILLDDVSNVRLSDFIIDGNKANNTGSYHGIRGIDVLDNIIIERVEVKNAHFYGIGFQTGTFTNITFRDIYIHNIDADGIDFKNTNDVNKNIVMDNITIQDFGKDATLGSQAAIDVRGPVKLSNIDVSNYGTDAGFVGIRLRAGEALDANGLGALYSQITNFRIVCDAKVEITYGINANTRFCQISNGYIEGPQIGVNIGDTSNLVSNVYAKDCKYGLYVADSGGSADDNIISNFVSDGATDDGFSIKGDNNSLHNCSALNSTDDGFKTQADADGTRIIGGRVNNNGGSDINDYGSNSFFSDISGWVLKNNGTGSIDSGSTSDTITHGLSTTPDVQHIVITGGENPTNSVGTIWIDNISSTTFQVNVENDPGASNWDFGWQAIIL